MRVVNLTFEFNLDAHTPVQFVVEPGPGESAVDCLTQVLPQVEACNELLAARRELEKVREEANQAEQVIAKWGDRVSLDAKKIWALPPNEFERLTADRSKTAEAVKYLNERLRATALGKIGEPQR